MGNRDPGTFVFIPFRVLYQNDEKKQKKQQHYIVQTHPHTGISAVCGFLCLDRQTKGKSDIRLQSLDFTPDGNSTIIPLSEDMQFTCLELHQTFTRSTCFLRNPLTKQTTKFLIFAVLTEMLAHLLDIWEEMINN